MATTFPTCRAFTIKYKCLSKSLRSTVTIKYGDKSIEAIALWDTGATGTCISKDVVNKLCLTSLGKQNMQTPSGTSTVDTYLINIILPNDVEIPDVRVCDSEIGSQGIDILIGMDIISQGDFAVSNYRGKTVFTFRIPSKQLTDYVEQINISKVIGPKHGKGKRKHR